jgi:hypothetical protein
LITKDRPKTGQPTMESLFALKVQRKVSNGVAGLAAGGTSFGSEEVAAQFVPAQ